MPPVLDRCGGGNHTLLLPNQLSIHGKARCGQNTLHVTFRLSSKCLDTNHCYRLESQLPCTRAAPGFEKLVLLRGMMDPRLDSGGIMIDAPWPDSTPPRVCMPVTAGRLPRATQNEQRGWNVGKQFGNITITLEGGWNQSSWLTKLVWLHEALADSVCNKVEVPITGVVESVVPTRLQEQQAAKLKGRSLVDPHRGGTLSTFTPLVGGLQSGWHEPDYVVHVGQTSDVYPLLLLFWTSLPITQLFFWVFF